MDETLSRMVGSFAAGNPIYHPSRFWEKYTHLNASQLETEGYENFKRTLARNYFTWGIALSDPQLRFLAREASVTTWPRLVYWALQDRRLRHVTEAAFTRLLWMYVEKRDPERALEYLHEPVEGNPARIMLRGNLISQDIANSVLEYYSMREYFDPDRIVKSGRRPVVCELGAGYGRNAWVMCNLHPRVRYIIVDIPPALYVADRYLSAVFPGRRVFHFRPFDRLSEVREELESADLAFLLPHQGEQLRDKSVDLFANISSLGEMTREQISAYFSLIDRVTSGHFYSKQWMVSRNAYDDLTVGQEQYPVPSHWRTLYHRPARVQTFFFEAMYEVPAPESMAAH